MDSAPTPRLSLIVPAKAVAPPFGQVLIEAAHLLTNSGVDYEILVFSADPVPWPIANLPVRSISEDLPSDYKDLLAASLRHARGALIAIADRGIVDCRALTYMVPLAEKYAIVWGYAAKLRSPHAARALNWCYSALVRLFLGGGIRECGHGATLAIFQREVLEMIQPESTGLFARAEVLARAQRKSLPVVDLAVPTLRRPGRGLTETWRTCRSGWAACARFLWSGVQFTGAAPAEASRWSWASGLLLAILAALILFPKLNYPLLDPDEGRQAEIPREMLVRGDLLRPRMQGELYFEKPPLQYWLTVAAYHLFGVHGWTARLVPTTAAWLTVLLTFAWGRRALGTRSAFIGGLILCLTPGFVVLGRTVVLDSLLGACVVLGWYAGHQAVAGPLLRWRWWVTSAVACGLGILVKGPVALLLLAVPLVAHQLLNRSTSRPRWRDGISYVFIALAVGAPWYISMALLEPDYLARFFWRANVLRFLAPYDHEHAWWFYVPILFVSTLPWSFLWPALIYFLSKRSRRLAQLRSPALGFCTLTTGWCFLFYSLAGCKSPPYLAPLFGPLALLLGSLIDMLLFQATAHKHAFLARFSWEFPRRAAVFVISISAGCYLFTAVFGWQAWSWALVKALLSLTLVPVLWYGSRRLSCQVRWATCAIVMLLFITLAMKDMLHGFASRRTPAPIARLVRHRPGAMDGPMLSYGHQWNSACFYLGREQVYAFDADNAAKMVHYLERQAKATVLVESGPPVQELLQMLPTNLSAEVFMPRREGQAAMVVLRHQ